MGVFGRRWTRRSDVPIANLGVDHSLGNGQVAAAQAWAPTTSLGAAPLHSVRDASSCPGGIRLSALRKLGADAAQKEADIRYGPPRMWRTWERPPSRRARGAPLTLEDVCHELIRPRTEALRCAYWETVGGQSAEAAVAHGALVVCDWSTMFGELIDALDAAHDPASDPLLWLDLCMQNLWESEESDSDHDADADADVDDADDARAGADNTATAASFSATRAPLAGRGDTTGSARAHLRRARGAHTPRYWRRELPARCALAPSVLLVLAPWEAEEGRAPQAGAAAGEAAASTLPAVLTRARCVVELGLALGARKPLRVALTRPRAARLRVELRAGELHAAVAALSGAAIDTVGRTAADRAALAAAARVPGGAAALSAAVSGALCDWLLNCAREQTDAAAAAGAPELALSVALAEAVSARYVPRGWPGHFAGGEATGGARGRRRGAGADDGASDACCGGGGAFNLELPSSMAAAAATARAAALGEAEARLRQALRGHELLGARDAATLRTLHALGAVLHARATAAPAEHGASALAAPGTAAAPAATEADDAAACAQEPRARANLVAEAERPLLPRARADLLAEAERLLLRARDGREQALGFTHLDTLGSAAALARVAEARGDGDEAEVQLRRALSGYEHALGVGAERTLEAAAELSALYWREAESAEAEALARRVLAGYGRLRGANDPRTLSAAARLASLLEREDEPETLGEVVTLLRAAHAGYSDALGDAHATTVVLASQLATALERRGGAADVAQARGLRGSPPTVLARASETLSEAPVISSGGHRGGARGTVSSSVALLNKPLASPGVRVAAMFASWNPLGGVRSSPARVDRFSSGE